MAWSTKQLADLAGTTVKTVRHYHEVGLLDLPERASNGYKQYGVDHLVRLLRIRRLVDLGVPLPQIATMGHATESPDVALRELDAELEASIERLERVRAELAMILRHQAPIDLPAGFSEVAGDMSEADRSLILIYSRVFGQTTMEAMREMLKNVTRSAVDSEFDDMAEDADEQTRQRVADGLVPSVRELRATNPWLANPGALAPKGAAYATNTVGQAMGGLYNPAQLDVLGRVHRALEAEKDAAASTTETTDTTDTQTERF